MEEGSDELERKIEKLNAQLARQTARAEKVHWRSGDGECPGAGGGCSRVSVETAGPLHFWVIRSPSYTLIGVSNVGL